MPALLGKVFNIKDEMGKQSLTDIFWKWMGDYLGSPYPPSSVPLSPALLCYHRVVVCCSECIRVVILSMQEMPGIVSGFLPHQTKFNL